jgi:Raf kinase inhibitor-like YbhB/YbcL family protein
MNLTTTAFHPGGDIPAAHTCEGQDVSPPLAWEGAPEATRSFVLICTDPDAPMGTWVHWLLFNLPAETRSLLEKFPTDPELPSGARQGRNDFGRTGYGGPCPPPGPAHRYQFALYALDARMDLKPGCRRAEVEQAMKGHILATAELTGRFSR